ncbi:MAG: rhodanese-like domain-containing protein [Saprospiraceae bacterium]|nr:rhodanese-like domain-containing protein [Saprospiraceae bacterium]
MKTISVEELKALMDAQSDFQLIDVREEYEYEEANIGGELIPMGHVMEHIDKFAKDKQVIVHCRSGKRSANVVLLLEKQGFDNLYNLEGGIKAWAAEIDPSKDVM